MSPAVRRHAGRRAAALPAPVPHSRAQYLYAEENILAPHIDLLREFFDRHALQQVSDPRPGPRAS